MPASLTRFVTGIRSHPCGVRLPIACRAHNQPIGDGDHTSLCESTQFRAISPVHNAEAVAGQNQVSAIILFWLYEFIESCAAWQDGEGLAKVHVSGGTHGHTNRKHMPRNLHQQTRPFAIFLQP